MYRIKELPSSELPRERLILKGAGALSDAELVAIVLRTGTSKQNALELSRSLIKSRGLAKLLTSGFEELCQEHGLGKAKACQLLACGELSSRINCGLQKPKLSTPEAAARVCNDLRTQEKEHLAALFLNTRNTLIKRTLISIGNLDSSIVDPREILKEALRCNAKAVILVHNHPSGDPQPSDEDIKVTAAIKQAAALLNIELLDHIILGASSHTSLREQGEL
jgi:DNA repair protein RadC